MVGFNEDIFAYKNRRSKFLKYFQKKRMPDGRNSITGNEVIFKNVNRKYSGNYICEGSNGSGLVVNDTITVDVLRKILIKIKFQLDLPRCLESS